MIYRSLNSPWIQIKYISSEMIEPYQRSVYKLNYRPWKSSKLLCAGLTKFSTTDTAIKRARRQDQYLRIHIASSATYRGKVLREVWT